MGTNHCFTSGLVVVELSASDNVTVKDFMHPEKNIYIVYICGLQNVCYATPMRPDSRLGEFTKVVESGKLNEVGDTG